MKALKTCLAVLIILLLPSMASPLSPSQAPDPSEMVREPIWAGESRIILCFEGGVYFMYRVEKMPFQFFAHGNWNEYIEKTYIPGASNLFRDLTNKAP